MKQSTHRILVKIMFCLLVLSLACGKPFTTEAAPRDARSYLELAKQERKKAEDYRNQSLRHRRGPFHSNLDHARLMKLAQQHENAAELYERNAEQLLDRASKPANSSERDPVGVQYHPAHGH